MTITLQIIMVYNVKTNQCWVLVPKYDASRRSSVYYQPSLSRSVRHLFMTKVA